MVSAINTAIGGLNNASKLLEKSAKEIAATPQQAGTAKSTEKPLPKNNTENALVNTDIASYNFKANLKVIKAADNNLKSLLNIKA